MVSENVMTEVPHTVMEPRITHETISENVPVRKTVNVVTKH